MLAGLSELKSRASFFLAPRPSKDSNETIETDWSQVHLVTTGVYDYTRHPIYAGLAGKTKHHTPHHYIKTSLCKCRYDAL